MALKQCKECGKQVSSRAKACPNCGAPTAGTGLATATSIARIILMVTAILSVIPALMLGGLLGLIVLIVPAVLFIMALCLK